MPAPEQDVAVAAEAAAVRRVAIVGNPRAGSAAAGAGPEALARAFAERGVHAVLVDVADAAAVAAAAGDAGPEAPDAVVAAGGDGTINAVANALAAAGGQRPMGIVPMGTFNYVARRYGLPDAPQDAVDAIIHGGTVPIDAGEVGGRLFLNNCSFGLYTSIIDARERHNRSWGRSRWVAAVSALGILLSPHRRPRIRLEHGGGALVTRASMVFVGANPLQLDGVDPQVAADVEGGALAIVVVRSIDAWRLVKLAVLAMLGRAAHAPEIEAVVARTATLRLRAPTVRVVVDGEMLVLRTPLSLAMRRGALRLRVPLVTVDEPGGETEGTAPGAAVDAAPVGIAPA